MRSHTLLDFRAVIVRVAVLSIRKMQLRIIVLHSKLIYFSVFLLADQNAFVKKLVVLSSVEGVVLHGDILLVVMALLYYYLRWFKLVVIMVVVFIVQNRIKTILVIALVQIRSTDH